MSSGYALHSEAFANLDDIRDYIAQENPDAADRVMSEIFDAVRGLCAVSSSGTPTPRPQFAAFALTLVREYLIAYAPDEKPLWVVAVMHGRRNPRIMAAILRARD